MKANSVRFRRFNVPPFGGLVLLLATSAVLSVHAQIGGSGWTLKSVTFNVQSPTNAPQNQRYWFTNNIYHCLVYSNDGAFAVGNTTLPRTEQRFTPDYTNGDIQYQAWLMAPSNENSYCVFQIHTGDAQSSEFGSTAFMAFWFTNYGGSVHDYSGTTLATNLGNQWFQLNVDHNLINRTIKVWINQIPVWTQQDNGAGDFYFKDGVYEQSHDPTYQMDTYVTNILMWTSPGSPVFPLTWTGQTNGVNVGTWDLAAADWLNATNGLIQVYQDGSPVTFDDSAPGTTAVTLPGTVLPASITVSNIAKDYTFSGPGGFAGSATLAKFGGGTLTVSTTNSSFTGDTTIFGGTVKLGNADALGGTSGSVVITNGATLDLNGSNLGAKPVTASGWGVSSNGVIVSTSASAQDDALQQVLLTGDTTFGGTGNWLASGNPGRWDIRGTGTILGTGGQPDNLYKVGSNQISLVGVTVDTNLANIDIQQGMLGFEDGSSSMGNPASNLIVRAGATVEFYQSSAPANSYTKQFVLYGGGMTPCITNWPGGGSSTVSGQMTLNGTCVIGVSGTSFTNNCILLGAGSLIKAGTQPLVLSGENTYSGDTMVSGGTMQLRGSGSISDSGNITIASGATLDASARIDGTLTLANGQTLEGGGTLAGNLTNGAGATLAPGDNGIGLLTIAGWATLCGTTQMKLNQTAATNDMLQAGGALLYGGILSLTNLSGTLTANNSFKLFNAASYAGAFTAIIPVIPAVNLAWNTNTLTSDGTLRITAAPTPPPKIGALAWNGGGLVLSGSNGVPDWAYYVLASTNLACPLEQWTPVATNFFDAGGNFSFTNPVSTGLPQTFYLLQLR